MSQKVPEILISAKEIEAIERVYFAIVPMGPA